MIDIELKDISKMGIKELRSYTESLEVWIGDRLNESDEAIIEPIPDNMILILKEDIEALHNHYARLLSQKMAITPNHRSQFAMMGTILSRLKLEL